MDPVEAAVGVQAAKALGDAMPQVVQPASHELGEGLGLAVHLVFGPLRRAHIRQEHAEKALVASLARHLEAIPPERRIEADPMITGPAILESQFVLHHEALREMYARLISSAADIATVPSAHPAFVSFIRQMTPDEARLLSYIHRKLRETVEQFRLENAQSDPTVPEFHMAVLLSSPRISGYREKFGRNGQREHSVGNASFDLRGANLSSEAQEQVYLTNLERLGLITTTAVEDDPNMQYHVKNQLEPVCLVLTPLGWEFCEICLRP